MIQGTKNDLESVRAKANQIGINSGFVNSMYNKYANTPSAKIICSLLGTSPEAIKDDAINIVGGSTPNTSIKKQNTPKFPRLK